MVKPLTRDGIINIKYNVETRDLDINGPPKEVSSVLKEVQGTLSIMGDAAINWGRITARFNSIVNHLEDAAIRFSKLDMKNFSSGATSTNKLVTSFDALGKMTTSKVTTASKNLSSIINSVDVASKSIDDDNAEKLKKMSTNVAKLSGVVSKLKEEDVDNFTDRFTQLCASLNRGSQSLDPEAIKLLGAGSTASARWVGTLKKYAEMSQSDYELGSQRESEQRRKRQEETIKFNEEEQRRRIERERAPFKEFFTKGWRVALFGEKEIGPDGKKRKKEGTGLLGQEIEMGVLKGLKGVAIGSIVGLIYKAITKYFQMIISMAKAPMNLLLKAGKFFGNMLKGALEQAKTFSALIDLAIKPFVLLFTLLFAPILAQLAPILADVIQKVSEWWPVIQEIGSRIADVIENIITNVSMDGITNFGNVIVKVIAEIDKMSRIVEDIFAGDGNIIEKISKAVSTLFTYIAEQFLSWAYSDEGSKTIIEIGKMIGRIAAEVVTVFGALIPIFIADIGTIIWGFGEELGRKFGEWWDNTIVAGVSTVTDWIYHLFDPIRDWLQSNAPWLFMSFQDVLSNIGNFFGDLWSNFTNGISNIWQSIVNAWNEFWSDPLGNIGRGISSIFDNSPYPQGTTTYNYQISTNYDSTYFQNTGGIGYRQAAPKEIML